MGKKGYIRNFQRVIGLGTEGDEWVSQGTESAGNLRRDVEVSDTQIDQVGEGLQTSESTGAILDHADDSVEAFGHGIGQARRRGSMVRTIRPRRPHCGHRHPVLCGFTATTRSPPPGPSNHASTARNPLNFNSLETTFPAVIGRVSLSPPESA